MIVLQIVELGMQKSALGTSGLAQFCVTVCRKADAG
jgi:hypothetical protein